MIVTPNKSKAFIFSAKKTAPKIDTVKEKDKIKDTEKNKTVAEKDREKLEKKFSKTKEKNLN